MLFTLLGMGEGQITALTLPFMQASCRTAQNFPFILNVSDVQIEACSDKSVAYSRSFHTNIKMVCDYWGLLSCHWRLDVFDL